MDAVSGLRSLALASESAIAAQVLPLEGFRVADAIARYVSRNGPPMSVVAWKCGQSTSQSPVPLGAPSVAWTGQCRRGSGDC